jgi:hypothetical protein
MSGQRKLISMISTAGKTPEQMTAEALQAIQTNRDANPHHAKDIDDEQ